MNELNFTEEEKKEIKRAGWRKSKYYYIAGVSTTIVLEMMAYIVTKGASAAGGMAMPTALVATFDSAVAIPGVIAVIRGIKTQREDKKIKAKKIIKQNNKERDQRRAKADDLLQKVEGLEQTKDNMKKNVKDAFHGLVPTTEEKNQTIQENPTEKTSAQKRLDEEVKKSKDEYHGNPNQDAVNRMFEEDERLRTENIGRKGR